MVLIYVLEVVCEISIFVYLTSLSSYATAHYATHNSKYQQYSYRNCDKYPGRYWDDFLLSLWDTEMKYNHSYTWAFYKSRNCIVECSITTCTNYLTNIFNKKTRRIFSGCAFFPYSISFLAIYQNNGNYHLQGIQTTFFGLNNFAYFHSCSFMFPYINLQNSENVQ